MAALYWLWTLARPQAPRILAGFLVMILARVALTVAFLAPAFFLDYILLGGHYDAIIWLIVWVLGANLVREACLIAGRQLWVGNEAFMNLTLNKRMLYSLYRKQSGYLDKQRTGSFVHYFTGDIKQLTQSLSFDLPVGVQEALNMLIMMALIGWASPSMLLLVVVVGVIYVWMGRRYGPERRAMGKEVQTSRGQFISKLEEGVSATREVVAFHRQAWEYRRFEESFRQYFDKVMKEGKMINRQLLATDPLKWLGHLSIIGIGGYEAIQGNISIGLVVVMYQFSTQVLDSFNQVFQFILRFSGVLGSVDRIKLAMDEGEAPAGHRHVHGEIREIGFHGVTYAYEKHLPPAIQDLTLAMPRGKKLAIVGGSGGGKSTIARLLQGGAEPDQGEIRINGVPLQECIQTEWRDRIAVVAQDPYLMPDTIRSNILLGREVEEERLMEICRVAQLTGLLQKLAIGLDTVIGERGITLSGGERQRIAIARALASEREILVLDEATSALDLDTERKLQAALDRYAEGKTVIWIAHRLSTVQNADIIYVMDQGRLVEVGTHTELMEAPTRYSSLVSAQVQAEQAG